MSTIAFLGTGTMGVPMARNLIMAGFKVRVWNRDPERAKPLADDGAEVCRSPADAACGATVLITMLSDAAAVLDCAVHAIRYLEPKAIWVQMSTVGVEGIELCQELAERWDVQLVDAPVLGARESAEKGELTVLASGPREALDASEWIFRALGSKTVRLGDVGCGTRGKLVANNWMLGLTAVLNESIALAQNLDIDPKAIFSAIADGPVDSPYAPINDLARKDAGLALAEVRGLDLDVPVLRSVAGRLDQDSIGVP